jgi:hypothetical protein
MLPKADILVGAGMLVGAEHAKIGSGCLAGKLQGKHEYRITNKDIGEEA